MVHVAHMNALTVVLAGYFKGDGATDFIQSRHIEMNERALGKISHQAGGRSLDNEFALIYDSNLIAHVLGFFHIVGGENNGFALLLYGADNIP
jgi:hypothetical protein